LTSKRYGLGCRSQQAPQSRSQAASAMRTTSCHPLRLLRGCLNARVAPPGPRPGRTRATGAAWSRVQLAATTWAAIKLPNLDAKPPLQRAPPTFGRVLERSRRSPRSRTRSNSSDGGCLVPGAARSNNVGSQQAAQCRRQTASVMRTTSCHPLQLLGGGSTAATTTRASTTRHNTCFEHASLNQKFSS
jgi:hypothetical protein